MSSSEPIGKPSIFRNAGSLSFSASSFRKCSRRASSLGNVCPRHSTGPDFAAWFWKRSLISRSSNSSCHGRAITVSLDHEAQLGRILALAAFVHERVEALSQVVRRRRRAALQQRLLDLVALDRNLLQP